MYLIFKAILIIKIIFNEYINYFLYLFIKFRNYLNNYLIDMAFILGAAGNTKRKKEVS
jgi:hypothetical protein